MNNELIVIVAEGSTEIEFYKKIVDFVKKKNGNIPFSVADIKYISAGGIGKMHKKCVAKFKIEIVNNFKDLNKIVFLCYDLDVFTRYGKKPPINLKQMRKDFKEAGAYEVIDIAANSCIEDEFLLDLEGIKNFLKLKKDYNVKKQETGLKTLEKMFKDASKNYTKGTKCTGLIESLNIELIVAKSESKILELIKKIDA